MNSVIEKLNTLFDEYKSGNINADNFYNQIWPESVKLPKLEHKIFYETIYNWVEAEAIQRSKDWALATFGISYAYFHSEEYEACLEWVNKALGLFTAINDLDGIAICSVTFGGVYRSLGDFSLAVKYSLEGQQQLGKSHKYPHFERACNYALASIYTETQNCERAIPLYTNVIELSKKTNIPFYILALDGMGNVHQQLGKYDIAMQYYDKALELSKEIQSLVYESRIVSDMANVSLAKKEYDKARELNQQALDIREKINATGGVITNMIQLAGILQYKGKVDESIEMLQKALEKAESFKVKPKILQIHQLLSELYQKQNRLDKSLEHFKVFHAVSDEVSQEDGVKRVKHAEMVFEAEQTKKENAIIRAQKEEIERKNNELQETIHELTITKVSRKAKAITLVLAVILIIAEEPIAKLLEKIFGEENVYLNLGAKVVIILCLKPIERAIEHYLLKQTVLKKRIVSTAVVTNAETPLQPKS